MSNIIQVFTQLVGYWNILVAKGSLCKNLIVPSCIIGLHAKVWRITVTDQNVLSVKEKTWRRKSGKCVCMWQWSDQVCMYVAIIHWTSVKDLRYCRFIHAISCCRQSNPQIWFVCIRSLPPTETDSKLMSKPIVRVHKESIMFWLYDPYQKPPTLS